MFLDDAKWSLGKYLDKYSDQYQINIKSAPIL